jgi:hypothetical protein
MNVPSIQKDTGQVIRETSGKSIITTSKRSRFTKPLLIVIAAVLVITISELGYYIYTKKGVGQKLETETSILVSPAPESRFYTPEMETPKLINYEKLADLVKNLEAFKSGGEFFQQASVYLAASGIVTESAFSLLEKDGLTYVYFIIIKTQSGQEARQWLTAKQVESSKTLLLSPGSEEKISLSEIKPGDFVTIKETIDLLDSSPQSEIILEVQR